MIQEWELQQFMDKMSSTIMEEYENRIYVLCLAADNMRKFDETLHKTPHVSLLLWI